MKLHILSDLHLEFGPFDPPKTAADVVILAGDIHVKGHGVQWAKDTFECPVIYVPGNHEYYGSNMGSALRKMRECAAGSNVHVLSDDAVTIGDVRFIGATLWTDYRITGNQPLAMFDAMQMISDFKKIRDESYRRITPPHISNKHRQSKIFIQDEVYEHTGKKIVVVSHHAPSRLSIHPRYLGTSSHLNAAYASDLTYAFDWDSINLWVHGHTHDNSDYNMSNCRVLCNPRGYAGSDVNEDFISDLVVDV